MEDFLIMVAPQLVIACAVLFLFLYGYKYNDPTD
ncbi:cytochrome bd oxidase small subunit CydS [Paenibacillus segetis]|jgi:hypothetical protein